MRFTKYHGLGNDFILLDERTTGQLISGERAKALCDRHRGIGADGVLTILPSREPQGDARLHIWNSDGSEAEMCGNGLRCVVRHLAEDVVIDTDAGLLQGCTLGDGSVRVAIGRPTIEPMTWTINVAGESVEGLAVSVGNPHFILRPYAEDVDLLALARRLGPAIERAPRFPDCTNVEFVSLRDGILEVVVFERGAGITQACGTGAAASVAAALRFGLIREPLITVHLPGGSLRVELVEGELFITGDAVHVFDGEVT